MKLTSLFPTLNLRRRSTAPAGSRRLAAIVATASLVFVAACDPVDSSSDATRSTTSSSQQSTSADSPDASGTNRDQAEGPGVATGDAAVDEIRHKLSLLAVKGRAPKTGYSRDQFGQRWKDTDQNGCDQRNDVLSRDMDNVDAPKGCKVLSGTLNEPYTGQQINFLRGQDTSNAVHIDHVVALSDAWQKGAQQLSPQRREELANDHRNLLAVDGPANMQKGDADAATWLPSNKGFRCQYVAIQVNVKHAYELWVTEAERDAISGILDGCGAGSINLAGDGTGTGAHAVAAVQDASPAPAPNPEPAPKPAPAPNHVPAPVHQQAPAPQPAPVQPAQSGGDVYYKNCAAARAAGAAPLHADEPGYRLALDRDRDGVACE